MGKEKVLKIGAEARLKVKGKKLVKERIRKGYRLKEIDIPLRKIRTQREANLMEKARRAKVQVPEIYKVDKEKAILEMDFINGKLLDRVLNESLAKKLGKEVAKLHSAGIIHGDLTTSNLIVKDNEIYFIDFGLGEFSSSTEKRGVDLRVLKEAIRANHPGRAEKLTDIILYNYKRNIEGGEKILERLEKIEKRGRYKER